MDPTFKIQVEEGHYLGGYDDLPRFVSYFYQKEFILKTKPKRVLEIGVGNKTLSNYLREQGIDVSTCDFDESLHPDYIADIRELPFTKPEFDCVVAFEILEHIPFDDFEKSIAGIARSSREYAVISVPYSSVYLEFLLRFPFIQRIIKRPFLRIFVSFPFFSKKFQTEEHCWELGRKGYPRRKLRKILRNYFVIEKEFRPPVSPHHYFFILKKK